MNYTQNLPAIAIEDAITIALGQAIKMGTLPVHIRQMSRTSRISTAVELGDRIPVIRDPSGNLACIEYILHQLNQYTPSQYELIKAAVRIRRDLYCITDAARLLRAVELEIDAVEATSKSLEEWKAQNNTITKIGLSSFLIARLGIEELTRLTVNDGGLVIEDMRARELLSVQHSLMCDGTYEAVRFSEELNALLPRVSFTSKESYLETLYTLYGRVAYKQRKDAVAEKQDHERRLDASRYQQVERPFRSSTHEIG